MTLEENKAVVGRLFAEVIDRGQLALLDALATPDVVVHTTFAGDINGLEGFRQFLGGFLAGFPQQSTEIHQLTAEGDRVAVRHTHHATHGGDFLGLPATGKTVAVFGLEEFRLRDGKIAETWHHDDMLGLFAQLGLVSLPQPAAV